MEEEEEAKPKKPKAQSLESINNFMSDDLRKKVQDSAEVAALGLDANMIGALFLKLVENRLNTLIWEAYSVMVKDAAVKVDLALKKPEAFVSVPVDDDLCLPVVHRVSHTKTQGSTLLCNLFGETWSYLEHVVISFRLPATF